MPSRLVRWFVGWKQKSRNDVCLCWTGMAMANDDDGSFHSFFLSFNGSWVVEKQSLWARVGLANRCGVAWWNKCSIFNICFVF